MEAPLLLTYTLWLNPAKNVASKEKINQRHCAMYQQLQLQFESIQTPSLLHIDIVSSTPFTDASTDS